MDCQQGIGRDQTLPWHLPSDMQYFKQLTTTTQDPERQNAVIMGRKTFDSIPAAFSPLPNRCNVVLSRQDHQVVPDPILQFKDLDLALDHLSEPSQGIESVFVIGGADIYALALDHVGCERLYITKIEQDCQCSTFFPRPLTAFSLEQESERHFETGLSFTFAQYCL